MWPARNKVSTEEMVRNTVIGAHAGTTRSALAIDVSATFDTSVRRAVILPSAEPNKDAQDRPAFSLFYVTAYTTPVEETIISVMDVVRLQMKVGRKVVVILELRQPPSIPVLSSRGRPWASSQLVKASSPSNTMTTAIVRLACITAGTLTVQHTLKLSTFRPWPNTLRNII